MFFRLSAVRGQTIKRHHEKTHGHYTITPKNELYIVRLSYKRIFWEKPQLKIIIPLVVEKTNTPSPRQM